MPTHSRVFSASAYIKKKIIWVVTQICNIKSSAHSCLACISMGKCLWAVMSFQIHFHSACQSPSTNGKKSILPTMVNDGKKYVLLLKKAHEILHQGVVRQLHSALQPCMSPRSWCNTFVGSSSPSCWWERRTMKSWHTNVSARSSDIFSMARSKRASSVGTRPTLCPLN